MIDTVILVFIMIIFFITLPGINNRDRYDD